MFNKRDRNEVRKIRHERVRKKISGTPARPRLCVFRSNKHIYAQVIDDVAGNTLVAASTVEKEIASQPSATRRARPRSSARSWLSAPSRPASRKSSLIAAAISTPVAWPSWQPAHAKAVWNSK